MYYIASIENIDYRNALHVVTKFLFFTADKNHEMNKSNGQKKKLTCPHANKQVKEIERERARARTWEWQRMRKIITLDSY